MVRQSTSFTSANTQHTFTTSNETNRIEVTLRGGKGQGGEGTDYFRSYPQPGESAGEITVTVTGEIANRSFTIFVGQQGGHSGRRSAGSSPFQGGISGSQGGAGGSGTYNTGGDGGGGGAPSAIELNGNVIAVAGGGDGGAGAGDDDSGGDGKYRRGGDGGSAALGDSYYRNVSTGNNDQTLFYSSPDTNVPTSVSIQQGGSTNNNAAVIVTEIRNPPAVNSLSATPQKDGSIDLSWSNPSTSTNKEIYRSSSHTGNATQIDSVGNSTTTYTDTGLNDGQSYIYYLKQVDSDGEKRGVAAAARTPKRDVLRYNESKDEWVPTDLTTL